MSKEKQWVVAQKRGSVYHEIKRYKQKNNAIDFRLKQESKSLLKYELILIKNVNQTKCTEIA